MKSPVLPLYNSTVVHTDPSDNLELNEGSKHPPQISQQRPRFRPSQNQLQSLYKSLLITFTVAIFFSFVIRDLPITDEEEEEAQFHRNLPSKGQFPSLEFPFEHSSLVGLYFAASWCPQSTPVTEKLDELFRDVLIQPPATSNDNNEGVDTFLQDQQHHLRKGLSIVYISSDSDQDSMESYRKPNWFTVPFSNVDERSDIKRFYKTCAKRELSELGFERKREIPSLIILSGETRDVLTYDGIQDIRDHGVQSIDHWLDIHRLHLALGDKYSEHY